MKTCCTQTVSDNEAFVSNDKGEFIAFAFTHRFAIHRDCRGH